MTFLCRSFTLVIVLVSLSACSTDPPKVRVSNQRAEVTDVQLKRSSGNTYNFNDIGAGTSSGYVEVETATYEVEAKVEGVSESATTFFTAAEDQSYTVVVMNSSPPTVRVDNP